MKLFLSSFLSEQNAYTTKSGDSLSAIARKHKVKLKDLLVANPQIEDPNKIGIGDSINIPGSKKKTQELTGLARYAADLKPYEGFRSERYDDHKGNPTVGYGHMIAPDSKKRFEAAGIGDQYHGVCVAGTCGLSEKDADKLLQQDIKDIYEPRTRKLLPNFDKLNPEAQSAAVGSTFRGGLSGSPKTQELLRQGKFKDAGKEFLDSKEYRESVRQGTGVHKRMKKYADAFSGASYTK